MCLLSVAGQNAQMVFNKMPKSVYNLSQKCVFYVFLLKHLLFSVYSDIVPYVLSSHEDGLHEQNFFCLHSKKKGNKLYRYCWVSVTLTPAI